MTAFIGSAPQLSLVQPQPSSFTKRCNIQSPVRHHGHRYGHSSSTFIASPNKQRVTLSRSTTTSKNNKNGVYMMVEQKTPPEMPDEAKAAVARGESVKYWAGEWICVDCGFIYNPKRRIKFEDLPGSWKCPQCFAPKRRFAKKAGDYIAETQGTSNLPIILFSILGLLATVLFGVWASTQL